MIRDVCKEGVVCVVIAFAFAYMLEDDTVVVRRREDAECAAAIWETAA